MRAKRTAAAVVIASLAVSSLAGCEAIERETGITKTAQVTALGTAAAGGAIAALAGASAGWIAGATILGTLAGGAVGQLLSDTDKQQYAESSYSAIEAEPRGGQTAWNNPDSGNTGITRIDEEFRRADGTRCKTFSQTITADGQNHYLEGLACQQPDGSWKVVEA